MNNRFILLCLLFSIIGWGCKSSKIPSNYKIDQTFTPQQLEQDYQVLTDGLLKWHPRATHYRSKDSLLLHFQQLKKNLDKPLSEREFRQTLRQTLNLVGCGHLSILPSKNYIKTFEKKPPHNIPIQPYWDEKGKLYLYDHTSKDSTLQIGSEILEIDGKKPTTIVNDLYEVIVGGDGFNTSNKKAIFNSNFRSYYTLKYGIKEAYSITCLQKDSTVRQHTLVAKELKINKKKRKKEKLVVPSGFDLYKPFASLKTFQKDTSLAIIKIEGFHGKHFNRFMRKAFKIIDQKDIKNLVIDLRDNGGGNVFKGNNFLKNILDEPFNMKFGRKLRPFFPAKHFDVEFLSYLSTGFFFVNPLQYWKKGEHGFYFYFRPRKRHNFNENIYVFTNGYTFSMATYVATYLKYKSNATIIGEETGGGLTGSNAMINGLITLPHSKQRIIVPLYHLYHQVKGLKDEGRGLMPDYPTHYSIEDILEKKDKDVEMLFRQMRLHKN